jgi:ABC-type polysaccharide/polyol phosphate transport system ATPase subunit
VGQIFNTLNDKRHLVLVAHAKQFVARYCLSELHLECGG